MGTRPPTSSLSGATEAVAVLRAELDELARAVDAKLFGNEPPREVNLGVLLTATMKSLARSRAALIDSEIAYVAVRKKHGTMPADAPAIEPEIALQLTQGAQLEKTFERAESVVAAKIAAEANEDEDDDEFSVMSSSRPTTRAWFAAVADWIEASVESAVPGRRAKPHEIEGALMMIAGLAKLGRLDGAADRLRSAAGRLRGGAG